MNGMTMAEVGLGGATLIVDFTDEEELFPAAVAHLVHCHDHNFAVIGDGRKIMCSEMAAECLIDAHLADR
jgi:hypothetical protein